jgi:hypothetical protein
VIREGVNIEKHVAATHLTKSAVAGGFRIKVLNLISALEDLEGFPFYYGNDGHGSATGIRTVGTQAVMHFIRRLVVGKTHRVIGTATATGYGKIVTRHTSLLQLSFGSTVLYHQTTEIGKLTVM